MRASQSNVSSRNPADVYFIEPIGTCDAVDGSNRSSKREALTILILNGTNVRVKLDMGAEVNVMPQWVFKQLKNKPVLEKTTVILKSYGGHDIPIVGKCNLKYLMGDKYKSIVFYMVNNKYRTIIGLDACEQLGLIRILQEVVKGDSIVEGIEAKLEYIKGKSGEELKNVVLKLYPDVFKGLGKINPPHRMRLKEL